jgi:ABC-type Fe3+ transport system permease subunit
VLRKVILPMAHKGLMGSFMFTFVLAMGDYVTPQLLGGRDGVTTGLIISNQFRSTGNWPLGGAMAFILLAVSLFAYFLLIQAFRAARLSPGRRYHGPLEGTEQVRWWRKATRPPVPLAAAPVAEPAPVAAAAPVAGQRMEVSA